MKRFFSRSIGLTGFLVVLGGRGMEAATIVIPHTFEREFATNVNNSGVGTSAGIGGLRIGDEIPAINDFDNRGIAEFDLAGQTSSPSVSLVFDQTGILLGPDFAIVVETYVGNNMQDFFADYSQPTTGTVATFMASDFFFGQTDITLDITALYNTAIANGDLALGVRFRQLDESTSFQRAVTYSNSHLVVAPEASGSTLLTMGFLGLIGSALRRKKRRRAVTSASTAAPYTLGIRAHARRGP